MAIQPKKGQSAQYNFYIWKNFSRRFSMINEIRKVIDDDKLKYSIVVKNLKTGETFKINEEAIVPSASTIKIFIMGEALRQAKGGRHALKERITVEESVKVPFSILTMLETGNSYSLKDIITLMIVQSDNTATNILIDLLGMGSINEFIQNCGARHTILQRKMMDFEARQEGRENYTCALDLANILELIYEGKIIDKEYSNLMMDILKLQLDKGMHLEIPDEIEIAHKPGELECLDHDAGIMFTGKGDILFAMTTWDAVSNNYARIAIGRAAKAVYDYFR
jgi:beta-lactamase class A